MDKLTNKEVLLKEIDLIQSCINRMANNSFLVKGWLISIIAVSFALFPEDINICAPCIISALITVVFWYLDAFFLKTEKLYRWKYNWVIANRLSCNEYFYDLNPYNTNTWLDNNGNCPKDKLCIISVMFSKTLWPLYLSILVVITGLYICLK